jgi:hypothetical protein
VQEDSVPDKTVYRRPPAQLSAQHSGSQRRGTESEFVLKSIRLEYIGERAYPAIPGVENPTHHGLSIETSWAEVLISLTIRALDEFLAVGAVQFSPKRFDRRAGCGQSGANLMRRKTDGSMPAAIIAA